MRPDIESVASRALSTCAPPRGHAFASLNLQRPSFQQQRRILSRCKSPKSLGTIVAPPPDAFEIEFHFEVPPSSREPHAAHSKIRICLELKLMMLFVCVWCGLGGESCIYSCNWLGGFVGPCRSKRGATLSFLIVTCVAANFFFWS